MGHQVLTASGLPSLFLADVGEGLLYLYAGCIEVEVDRDLEQHLKQDLELELELDGPQLQEWLR